MSITRIAKLKGFPNIIAGRDLAGIFKDGHVYQVVEIAGEIVISDLGEHAETERYGKGKYGFQKWNHIMMDGAYLLTKDEYKKQLKEESQD